MTIRKTFMAGSLAMATALGAVAPAAQAAPLRPVPLAAAPMGEVVPVQARRRRAIQRRNQRIRRNRAYRQGFRQGRRYDRRDRRRSRRNLAAGIVGGLIVGGIIADAARRGPVYAAPPPRYRPAPAYGYGPRHHDWCYARYRSYRASDGTYQPYHGPRRRCNSPYDGI